MDVWRKSFLVRGKGQCKGPEVEACLAYPRKEAPCLEYRERGVTNRR